MKITPIILLTLLIFFSSCKKDTQKSTEFNTENIKLNLLDTLILKLDNGKKWVVNEETQIGVNKMDSLIIAFNKGDEKDFLNLGKDLSAQTSFIIRSCNMQGEAHDQLHVVLVPMLDEIFILKESNSKQESKRALNNLEELIDEYFNHFKH